MFAAILSKFTASVNKYEIAKSMQCKPFYCQWAKWSELGGWKNVYTTQKIMFCHSLCNINRFSEPNAKKQCLSH